MIDYTRWVQQLHCDLKLRSSRVVGLTSWNNSGKTNASTSGKESWINSTSNSLVIKVNNIRLLTDLLFVAYLRECSFLKSQITVLTVSTKALWACTKQTFKQTHTHTHARHFNVVFLSSYEQRGDRSAHFVRMQVSARSELSDAAFRKQMREARAGHVLGVTLVTHETPGVWQGPASLLRWQQLSVYFRLLQTHRTSGRSRRKTEINFAFHC